MGGCPVLGYDVDPGGGGLVVNQEETCSTGRTSLLNVTDGEPEIEAAIVEIAVSAPTQVNLSTWIPPQGAGIRLTLYPMRLSRDMTRSWSLIPVKRTDIFARNAIGFTLIGTVEG